jgi:peptidoglycan/LPS O-acetylase OafA/YrhL
LFRTGTSLEQGMWTNSIVQFQFFGIGALIALHLHGNAPNIRAPVRILMLLAGTGLWLLASGYFQLFGTREFVTLWQVMMGYGSVAVGCALLCVGTLGAPPSWFPKGLVFLGKISYGLYVFHLLGLRLPYTLSARLHGSPKIAAALLTLRIPLALALTVAIACLSYRFFETPFLRMKERFTFVQSRGI